MPIESHRCVCPEFFSAVTVPFATLRGPPRRSTPKILHQASELRKQSTPAEMKLWAYLRLMRENGVRFRRQHAIGPYITDFPWHRPPGRCARHAKRLLLNRMDSLRSQHLDQAEYDDERTMYLEAQGYKVIRFWNNQVINDIEGVLKQLMFTLETNE